MTTSTFSHRQGFSNDATPDCRTTCAARRNPNAECVCAELDEMGVPDGMTVREFLSARQYDVRRTATLAAAARRNSAARRRQAELTSAARVIDGWIVR